MSAFGPRQTWASALHMSAFGGKADMTICRCLLSRSLLGVKRTCVAALHESAFDPKRTSFGSAARGYLLRTPRLTILCVLLSVFEKNVEGEMQNARSCPQLGIFGD